MKPVLITCLRPLIYFMKTASAFARWIIWSALAYSALGEPSRLNICGCVLTNSEYAALLSNEASIYEPISSETLSGLVHSPRSSAIVAASQVRNDFT